VGESSGILLQVAAALLERLILLEETQTTDFMKAEDVKLLLKPHLPRLTQWAQTLPEGSRNRRNRSQNSVFLRKLLLLLQNYRN
jgi:hypothetical protein